MRLRAPFAHGAFLTLASSTGCRERPFHGAAQQSVAACDENGGRDVFLIVEQQVSLQGEFQCWFRAGMGAVMRDFRPHFEAESQAALEADATRLLEEGRFAPLPSGGSFRVHRRSAGRAPSPTGRSRR